jgi:phage terminase large subunit-like protein
MKFVETYCKVPEGTLVGQNIKLAAFQERFFYALYDNKHGTRRAYLSIARKNSKTSTIACIVLIHLVGPEAQQNSMIQSGAQSRDQAAQVYNYASKMVMLSDKLQSIIRLVPSGKKLIGIPKNTEYRAMSAEAKTTIGGSPILAVLDEVGQIKGPQDDFVDAITTGQGAHENPLLIAISTQAAGDGDMFSIWLDDAKNSKDPSIVSHVYEAPKDCELDDKKAWKSANPALGLFRSERDLAEQAKQAMRMPSAEPTFKNLCLNQRCEVSAPFVSRGIWILNSQEPDEQVFYEEPVYVGLDLSAKTDLTAMVVIAFREKWHVKAYFWTPAKGLRDRAKRDRAPYDIWEQQGLIRAIPGAAVDYEAVARDMRDILEDCNVQAIAFDRWRFDLLKKELDGMGADWPLLPFGQGFKDMAPAIDSLEEKLLNEQIAHGGNPVLTMCMANAIIERDAAGNRKMNKAKATGRIDGAVALAMAVGVCKMDEDKLPVLGADYELMVC